ncbi:MAG TPA: DUF2207 domain-containing protein [Gemmatimonadaceae bacterium]|nr:DUF2207 domain-containing protein [Gemmatimonadaceae bacterium]
MRRATITLAALASLIAVSPLGAQRELEIQRFDANIGVQRDGDIDVTESIQAHFTGQWNGIYRKIPVQYRTPQGFNWTIRIQLVSATDDQGTPLETETLREGHYIKYKIWVPGANDATRTVVLRYRAKNALRFFEEHDELYWNVTGDEWDVPLGMTSAHITLPSGASGLRATAFNGVYGSTATEAAVDIQDTVVRIVMPRKLEFREGLTAVVGWNKGLVPEPTAADRASGFLAANWPLIIPLVVFAGMFTIWWRRGRDPRRRPVAVQYEPPDGLTPGEAGTLTDERADMRDITATVVDLAVRGFLRIEEKPEEKLFGLLKGREYFFHRVKPRSEWQALATHERRVLDGIFRDGGDVVELSDLENQFYKSIPEIKTGIMDRLVGKGYYVSRPDNVRMNWRVGALVLGVALAVGGSALSGKFGLTPVPFVIAGAATALIMLIIGHNMPARSVQGTRTLEGVLGFTEFLDRVEKDRFERVVKTPEMFERFLPYAMAFGVERKWARAFSDIYRTPPTWYSGSNPGAFSVAHFSSSLSDMTARTASTMSSAPRSSGGSGFSGGSSGGGGGGGGGGGF